MEAAGPPLSWQLGSVRVGSVPVRPVWEGELLIRKKRPKKEKKIGEKDRNVSRPVQVKWRTRIRIRGVEAGSRNK